MVVDEAYGQFAPFSALDLMRRGGPGRERLVVVRTFSKTWSMAACRLGYLVAHPDVVAACESVALPYHLDAMTQAAGRLALRHVGAMEARVALLKRGKGPHRRRLGEMKVQSWPSDANFVFFRPLERAGHRRMGGPGGIVGPGARLFDRGPASISACGSRWARPGRTTGS